MQGELELEMGTKRPGRFGLGVPFLERLSNKWNRVSHFWKLHVKESDCALLLNELRMFLFSLFWVVKYRYLVVFDEKCPISGNSGAFRGIGYEAKLVGTRAAYFGGVNRGNRKLHRAAAGGSEGGCDAAGPGWPGWGGCCRVNGGGGSGGLGGDT